MFAPRIKGVCFSNQEHSILILLDRAEMLLMSKAVLQYSRKVSKEINLEWKLNSREKKTILCWDLWEENNVIVTFQPRITYPSEMYS